MFETQRYALSWQVFLSMLIKLVLFTKGPLTIATEQDFGGVFSLHLVKFQVGVLDKGFVAIQAFVACNVNKINKTGVDEFRQEKTNFDSVRRV